MNLSTQDNPITNPLTGEVTPLGAIVNQPKQEAPPEYDYLPWFANGASTEQIQQNTRDGKIVPLSRDQAYQKYKGPAGMYKDLNDDQFNTLYDKSMESYNDFAQNKFNGFVADRWQYDGPTGLSGNVDMNKPSSGWSNPGYDEFGTPTATVSEVAAARGYIIGEDGKKTKYEEPGLLGKAWVGATGLLPGELAPLLQGKDPTKLTTVQFDDEGMPVLMEKGVDDEAILRSQIFSSFGPQPMKESIVAGLLKTFYNGVAPSVYSMVGSTMEKSDDLFDLIAYGKDKNGFLDRQGRILQNIASANSMPIGAEGSMGAFDNAHSLVNAIGAMIPLILLTKGAGAGFGAAGLKGASGHMAGSFSVFAALGIDSYNQAAKEMGIDPADAAWQSMMVGMAQGAVGMWAGPKFLTKGLETLEMKSVLTKRITALGEKYSAQIGKKIAVATPNEKLHFARQAARDINEYVSKNLADATTTAGRFLDAAHGGGRMMALMQPPQILAETINDWQALINDPGAKPGQGMFAEYDQNRSFISQVIEKAPNKMIESYAIGFLGSITMGIPGLFGPHAKQTVHSIVANGKEAAAYKIIEKAHAKGEWGRTDMTEKGEIITSDMVGRPGIRTINDAVAEQAKAEIQQLAELRDFHGLRDANVLKVVGGDPKFTDMALTEIKGINDSQNALKEIQSKQVAEPTDAQQIIDLKADITSRQTRLDDIIKPEHAGTPFSKVYNESFKNKSSVSILAKEDTDTIYKKVHDVTDVTDKQRRSPEYQKMFALMAENQNKDPYSTVKEFNDVVGSMTEAAIAKQKDYADNLIANTEKVGKFTDKASKLDVTSLDTAEKITQAGHGLVKEIADLSTSIDIHTPGKELGDKARVAFSEAMTRINEQIKASGALVGDYATEAPTKEFKEPVIDKKAIQDEAYVKTIGKFVNEDLKKQMDQGWNDWGSSYAQVVGLMNQISKNKLVSAITSKVLPGEKMKEHLSMLDSPIESEQGRRYNVELDWYQRKLENYRQSLLAKEGMQNNYHDNTLVHHMEKSKFALMELNDLLVKVDPSFRGLWESLPDWTADEKDITKPITDRKKLNDAQAKLTEIKSKIFEKSSELLKDENLVLLKEIIGKRKFNGTQDTYLKINDYKPTEWLDFNEVLNVTDGTDFLSKKSHVPGNKKIVDLGYIYTINLLLESVGADAKKLETSRQEKQESKEFGGEDYSSIEQQQAENLAFSFKKDINHAATKMMRQILTFEAEITGKDAYDRNIEINFVPGLIFIRGEYKTGKTTQVLRNIYLLDHFYEKDVKRKVCLVGISENNVKVLAESLKGTGHEVITMTDVEFLNNSKKKNEAISMDDIVFDEASLLSRENLRELRKLNENNKFKVIAMGDDGQMKDVKDALDYPVIEESGVRTLALMKKYSKDNILVNKIANEWGKNTAKKNRTMPGAFTKVNEVGEKTGATYYENISSVVEAFKGAKNTNKKLIVFDQEAWDGADGVQGLKSQIPIELYEKVYVIAKVWGKATKPGDLPSVQGLRTDEAYLALDRSEMLANGIEAEPIRRIMYTSIGRAASWVGLVDSGYKELNKATPEEVNWVERVAADPVKQKIAFDNARKLDLERLSNITGVKITEVKEEVAETTSTRTSDRVLESPPSVGEYHRIVGGENDGKFAYIDTVDGEKILAGVGATMAEAKGQTALADQLVSLRMNDLEYLDEGTMKKKEPSRKAPVVTEEAPIVIHKEKEMVTEWKAGGSGKSKNVWATTHTVVASDLNISKEQVKQKRKITPILHKMINNFFTPELVYLKEAWMEGADGKMELFHDVLSIRLNRFGSKEALLSALKSNLSKQPKAFKEIEAWLETHDNLPDHYRNIMSLAVPQTLKNGADRFGNKADIDRITDVTLENMEAKKAQIVKGFKKVKDGDVHSEMNSYLVDIIAHAKSRLVESNEPGVVSIKENISFDGPEKYKAKVDQSNKVSLWDDFVAKHKGEGITFGSTVKYVKVAKDWIDGKTGKSGEDIHQRYVVRFSHGEVSDANSYVIVRRAKLGEIAKSHNLPELMGKKMEEDFRKADQLKDMKRTPETTVDFLRSTFLFEFISNSRAFLLKKPELKEAMAVLNEFGEWKAKDGYTSFFLKSKGENTDYSLMIDTFKSLWKSIVTPENLKKFYDLEAPLSQQNKALKVGEQDPFEQFFAYGDEIHSPYVYASLDNIRMKDIGNKKEVSVFVNENAPIETTVITEKSIEPTEIPVVKPTIAPGKNESLNPAKRGIDPLKKYEKENPVDGPEVKRVLISQVETLFKKIAHPDVWKAIDQDLYDRGIAPLQYDGKYLFGMMRDGKIKLELTERGVELTTPKHEFWHLVFNHMIGEDARRLLHDEAKTAMSGEKIYKGKKSSDFTDLQAEEWMAKKYGETGLETDSKNPSVKRSIAQRFVDMVKKLFGIYQTHTYEIDSMMYKIDHGMFKDIMPVIKSGEEIIRESAREENEDLPETAPMNFFNKEVPKIFGRKEIIDSIRRNIIERTINDGTDFSNNLSNSHTSLAEAIRRTEDGLKENTSMGSALSGFKDAEGKRFKYVNEMTPEDFLLSQGPDWQSPGDKSNYIFYHLSDSFAYGDQTRRAFIQRVFPELDFRTFDLGKYNQSTQFADWKNWSPEQGKSGFLKFELRVTPLLKFDEKGNIIGEGEGTVNYKDLDRSLKQAGKEVMLLHREDTTKSYKDHFIEELKRLSGDVVDQNPKRDNILSFLNRFYTGNQEFLSFDTISQHLRPSKDPGMVRRAENLEDFLTATSMYYASLSYQERAVMKLTREGNGDTFFRLETYAKSTAEHEKNRIIDGMKWRLYANGMPRKDVLDRISMTKTKDGKSIDGERAVFHITENGLYYVKGVDRQKTPVQLISHANGKIGFTEAFDANTREYIQELMHVLGLNNVNQSAFMSLINGKASEGAKRILRGSPGITDQFDGRDFMGKGIMNLFWSLKSNVDSMQRIHAVTNPMVKAYEAAVLADPTMTEAKFKKTVEGKQYLRDLKIAKSTPMFDKLMEPFRNDLGVKGTVDGQETMMNTGELSTGDYKLPKPTDYYNFFNVLGQVNAYQKGLDFDSHFYAPDGTKQWNFKLHSKFSKLFDGGSSWMVRKGIRMLSDTTPEGKLKLDNSADWDPKRKIWLNQLYDEKGIELVRSMDFSGIKMDDKGSNTPNIKDLNNMAFHAWKEGLFKSSNDTYQKNIFINTNVGDSGIIRANEFNFSPHNKKEKFINLVYEGQKLVSAKVNEDFINKSVATQFHKIHRMHELSKDRWLTFASDKRSESVISTVPKEIWAKGETLDITSKRIQEWKSPELSAEQMYAIKGSDLELNTDYIISKDGKRISFGNALLWKVDGYSEVYNYHNYKNVVEPGKLDTKTRDHWFESKYKGMASKMSFKNSQFKQDNDIRDLIATDSNDKTNGFYRTQYSGDRAWQSRIIEWNEMYKGFFYGFHISNNAIGDIAYGNVVDLGSTTTKSKRSIPVHTPASSIDISGAHSLRARGREIVWDMEQLKSLNLEDFTEVADGAHFMGMYYETFFKKSLGGFDYGPVNKTMYKTLNASTSATGSVSLSKEASDAFSGPLFLASMVIRKMNFDIMDLMDKEIKEIHGDNYADGMIRRKFDEFFEANRQDPQKAFDLLHNWTVYDARMVDGTSARDIIKDNLISGFRSITAHKAAVNRINYYDPRNPEVSLNLRSREISNQDLSVVLNPYQEITDRNRLAPPQQILSMLGIGHEGNRIAGKRIAAIQKELYSNGKAMIDKEINKFNDSPDLAEHQQFQYKFAQFLHERGLKMIKAMSVAENFAELMADPKNFMTPQVYLELKKSYWNYVNKEAIKIPMTGIRSNQSSGITMDLFKGIDENHYTLQDIERNHPAHMAALKAATGRSYIMHPTELPEGYQRSTINEMTRGEQGNNKAQIAMPFLYRNEFGLRPEETLADAFTIRFKNQDGTNESINTRKMTAENVAKIIDQNEGMQNIDLDNSPMLRNQDKFGGHENYRLALESVLTTYASRVPASSIGSGASYEVAMFAEGNGNVAYRDPRGTINDNSDFDIDQLSTYVKNVMFDAQGKWIPEGNRKSQLQNEMLDIIHSVYADGRNAERIFTASSTKELRDVADKVSVRKGSNADNDYASTLEQYKQAKEGRGGVGIEANSLGAYSRLAQVEHAFDVKGLPGVLKDLHVYGYEAGGRRIERVLQTLLDNAKELAIGRLGITKDSVNLVAPFILDMLEQGKTSQQTTEALPEFFRDPVVKRVLDDVELGNSITESRREHYIFEAINRVNADLRPYSEMELAARREELVSVVNELDAYTKLIEGKVRKSSGRLKDSEVFIDEVTDYINAVEPDLAAKYYDLEYRREELRDGIDDTRGKVALEKLYNYAVQAESMRRFADLLSMQNGVNTADFDFGRDLVNFQNYFGQSISDYNNRTRRYDRTPEGEEQRIKDHLDFFKANNNEWKYVENGPNADRILKVEEAIARIMNLPEVLRSVEHISEYMKEFEEGPERFKNLSWEDHTVKDAVVGSFLKRQNLFNFDFKTRAQAVNEAWQSVFLDHYFRTFHSDTRFDISIPQEVKENSAGRSGWQKAESVFSDSKLTNDVDRNNFMKQFPEYHSDTRFDISIPQEVKENSAGRSGWQKAESVFSDSKLTNDVDRNNFMKQFPEYHDFLVRLGNMPKEKAVGAIMKLNNGEYDTVKKAGEVYDALQDNKFLQAMVSSGRDESPILKLNDVNNTPDQILMYSQEFKRLPQWLQDAYTYNQYMNTGFNFRQGSMLDIIGKEIYTREGGISQGMERFKSYLDGMGPQEITDMGKKFFDYVINKDGATSYHTKAMEKNNYHQEAELSSRFLKSALGEGGITVKAVKVTDPQDITSKDGKVPVYPITGRGGYDNTREESMRIEPIRLSAQEVDELGMAKRNDQPARLYKSYVRGHKYKIGQDVWADGYLMKVTNATATEVWLDFGDKTQEQILKSRRRAQVIAKNGGVEPLITTEMENHSGGAAGSDSYWDAISKKYGIEKITHYFSHGTKSPLGNKEITSEEQSEGWTHVLKANETLKRIGIEKYKGMLSRNWFQVKNADSIFAVGQFKDSVVDGGTGWAVQMAIDNRKSVFVFDQKTERWNFYDYTKKEAEVGMMDTGWVKMGDNETPRLTGKFAGIGTREIKEAGKRAINNVFEVSFPKDKASSVPESREIRAFEEFEGKRHTQKAFESVVEKLREKFPQLNFNMIGSTDAVSAGKSANIRGWVNGRSIFLNMDNMKSITSVHEMQHVWNAIASVITPGKYKAFEDHVRAKVMSGSGDIYRLGQEIKRMYPEFRNDPQGFINEMMATIGGFVSEPAVERFLRKSNSIALIENASLPRRLYEQVKSYVSELWHSLVDQFNMKGFNVENKDLKEFYTDFTNRIFNGEGDFKFTPQELGIIESVRGESVPPKRKEIEKLIDIIPFLSNKVSDPMKLANLDEVALTDWLHGQIVNNSGGGKNYYYYVGSKAYKFPVATYKNDPAKLKNAIMQQIVPEYRLLEQKLPEFLKLFMPQAHKMISQAKGLSRGVSLRQVADGVFGVNRISDSVLTKMTTHLGLFNEIKEVVSYDKLTGHSNVNVRNLYRSGLEGFNPLVVIHGIDADGTVNLSLLDATSKPLGEKMSDGNVSNIFNNFMSDGEYRNQEGPTGWGNQIHSARKFMLGLQMLAMQKNSKVRFRNIGVVEIHGNSLKSHPIMDMGEPIQLIKILRGNKEFMDSITNSTIRDLILDKTYDGKDTRQSFVSRMNYWLQDHLDNLGDTHFTAKKIVETQLGVILNPSASREDIMKVYSKRLIDLEHSFKGSSELKYNDPEYQLLSNAIFEMKNEGAGAAYHLRDMSRLSKRVMSPVNHHSDIIQRVVSVAKIAKEKVVDRYMGYHDPMNKKLAAVVAEYRLAHPGDNVGALGKDMGGKFFESMWKKRTIRVGVQTKVNGVMKQAGSLVEARMPELHWDITNAETQAALNSGRVTHKQIEAAATLLNFIKERQIENIFQSNILDGGKENLDAAGNELYTRDKAREEYERIFPPEFHGMIPTMERSTNELLMGKDIKRGFQKFGESLSRDNEFFDDQLGKGNDLDSIGAAYGEQMMNPMKMYEKMGIRRGDDGNLELFDGDANNLASANVERIGNYFMLQSIRKEVYEKEVMPVFNIANAIMRAIGTVSEGKNNQEVNIKFLNELKDRFVFRKNADDQFDPAPIKIAGQEIHVKTVARSLMHAYTGMTIFGRPMIGVKSAFFNETRRAMSSIAMSLANIGVTESASSPMPTVADANLATLKFTTEPGKVIALGKMFHIINRDERDLIESPFLNLSTKTNLLQEQWGHIFNYGTDVAARMAAAVSWMIHEGSYEAYKYDPASGELKYDAKSDRRFYNEDKTQTPEQKVLYNGLVNRLREQGLNDATSPDAIRGHDWDLVTNQLKWYGDKWVVSGMDDLTKTLASNMYISGMFSQFRLFSFEPLFNAGLFAGNRETIGGSKFKAVDDGHGNLISQRELREIEGSWQSFGAVMHDLYNIRKLSADQISFKKYWSEMPETRRFNLVRSTIQAATFATFGMLLANYLSPDDEQKYSWVYSDLLMGYSSMAWLQNPIPMVKGATDLANIAFGEKDLSRLIKFSGPIQGVTELIPSSE